MEDKAQLCHSMSRWVRSSIPQPPRFRGLEPTDRHVFSDALPDIGHACGHNLIATASVAAGLAAAELMKRSSLRGKVVLFGTPAEEGSSAPQPTPRSVPPLTVSQNQESSHHSTPHTPLSANHHVQLEQKSTLKSNVKPRYKLYVEMVSIWKRSTTKRSDITCMKWRWVFGIALNSAGLTFSVYLSLLALHHVFDRFDGPTT